MPLPKLTPKRNPWLRALDHEGSMLQGLLEEHGSPINLHELTAFDDNIARMKAVMQRHEIKHQIFFARKANKCGSLVTRALKNGIGVDTASLNEMRSSVDLGGNGETVINTSVIKDDALIGYAISHGILLILDNEDEIIRVKRMCKELDEKARVGIRIGGFVHEGEKLFTRFGFDVDDVRDILEKYMIPTQGNLLMYEGLHFHLDGYDREQRGTAMHWCMDLAQNILSIGLDTQFVDAGGGILMNYLEDATEWNAFMAELHKSVLGERMPITYRNDGLGHQLINGELHGKLAAYPYYNDVDTEQFLEQVLSCRNSEGKTVAQRLREQQLELRIEPGRSLLNQVGATVARVSNRKKDARGQWLVGLEMNMTQMRSGSADFLLDPSIVYQDASKKDDAVEVYFTGAYCLERDVLLKRAVQLKRLPDVGDIVIFPNTAGYMMHFFESEAHMFDLAKNLVTVYKMEQFAPFMEDSSYAKWQAGLLVQ